MGCGSIKTSESNDQLIGNISQSELLPEVHVNQKVEAEVNNSISHPNSEQSNNISINKKQNSNSNNSSKKNKEQKSFNSLSVNNKENEESKKIELNNNKKEKEVSYESNSIFNSEENESEKNNEEKKEEENSNKKINKNHEKDNILKKKAHTTDKIPKYKSNIILSSIQNQLPKVIQNNTSYIEKNFLEIELKANRYETIFPIWIQKEEEIEFAISGKWKINNEIECDCKGIDLNKDIIDINNDNNNENENNKFNDGALIGRILKGQPFLVYNGLKFTPELSGPLILKMNLNSIWAREKPEGTLKIKIYGAYKMENVDDLEEKIGWWKQLRNIDYNNKEDLPNYKLPFNEKSVIVLFNKLRHDSKLFTSQYLDNYQKLTPTTKKIYNQFISNKDQFLPFKINLSIIKLLQNFYNKFMNNKTMIKDDDWTYILRSENCLQKYLEESFNNKKKLFISIIRYYEDNPFYLSLRILFRDNIRNNMLNYNFEEMSMITLSDDVRKDGKIIYYCIVVLSNQNGNDNVNYEIDMNIEKLIENEKKLEVNLSIVKEIKKNLNTKANVS